MFFDGWGVILDLPLRSPANAFFATFVALPVWAEPSTVAPVADFSVTSSYELGGSVERAARTPATLPLAPQPRAALSLPLTPANSTRRETSFYGIVIFADEGWDDGRDAFRLGTAYTQGSATAGVSVTYLDEGAEISRSELYVDYALGQNFTIGVAGILDNDYQVENDAVPQLGVNAVFSTEGGTFLEGGVANAESSVPVFGLSIGLRF
ncbi:MAG: hypothetical protein HKN27_04690 [Silicimonas sp.]|nr:hypothetical protein [Silicimonas sp.]